MKTIAVLTRNARLYTSRRLIQAIRIAGHSALVVDPFLCTLTVDPIGIRLRNRRVGPIDAVIPRLGNQGVGVVLAVLRQFEMLGSTLLNAPGAIENARDKWRTYQLLAIHNLPVPATLYTTNQREIDRFISQHNGGCVIKVLDGLQGAGVMLAESRSAAHAITDWLISTRTDFLVQVYVAESSGSDVRCLVLDGEVIGAMRRQGKPGEFRSNLHRGGDAFPVTLTAWERQTAVLATKVLGLRCAGVDLLRSASGPLVLEVNASPGLEGIEGILPTDMASQIVGAVI